MFLKKFTWNLRADWKFCGSRGFFKLKQSFQVFSTCNSYKIRMIFPKKSPLTKWPTVFFDRSKTLPQYLKSEKWNHCIIGPLSQIFISISFMIHAMHLFVSLELFFEVSSDTKWPLVSRSWVIKARGIWRFGSTDLAKNITWVVPPPRILLWQMKVFLFVGIPEPKNRIILVVTGILRRGTTQNITWLYYSPILLCVAEPNLFFFLWSAWEVCTCHWCIFPFSMPARSLHTGKVGCGNLPLHSSSSSYLHLFWIGSCETGWNKVMECIYPGIPTTIKTMGVNITTIVYLRVLIIQIGSTIIFLMVVEAQGI